MIIKNEILRGAQRAFFVLSFVLSINLLLIESSLADDDCKTVELNSRLGAPRDQGGTGWCYAHTAADLISFQTGHRISAFDLATRFAFYDPELFLMKINELKKGGKFVPISFREFEENNPGSMNRWTDIRTQYKESLKEKHIACFHAGYYQHGGLDEVATFLAHFGGVCDDSKLPISGKEIEIAAEELIKKLELGNFEVEKGPNNNLRYSTPFKEILFNWLREKCGERKIVSAELMPRSSYISKGAADFLKEFPDKNTRMKKQIQMFEQINELLDENNIVSIGYSLNEILEDKSDKKSDKMDNKYNPKYRHQFLGNYYLGILNKKLREMGNRLQVSAPADALQCSMVKPPPEDEDDLVGDHASIISGRKFVKGKCHYFVRNSYGKDCSGFKKDHVCEKELGGTWVPRDELSTAYSIVWTESLRRPLK